jgi:hypothetical protein
MLFTFASQCFFSLKVMLKVPPVRTYDPWTVGDPDISVPLTPLALRCRALDRCATRETNCQNNLRYPHFFMLSWYGISQQVVHTITNGPSSPWVPDWWHSFALDPANTPDSNNQLIMIFSLEWDLINQLCLLGMEKRVTPIRPWRTGVAQACLIVCLKIWNMPWIFIYST